jgi:hypothetical protein
LLNPHQLPAHGRLCRCAAATANCRMAAETAGRSGRSLYEERPNFTRANFGWSVGHPTYMEDFHRAGCWVSRFLRRDAGWRQRRSQCRMPYGSVALAPCIICRANQHSSCFASHNG